MSTTKSQRKLWVLVVAVFAVTGVLLSACVQDEPAPERSFTTMELLIGLSDMPLGWQVSNGPGRTEDYISGKDASRIVFTTGSDLKPGRDEASHRVYRYDSPAKAKKIYEDLVLPGEVGKTPPEWMYQSPIAAQYRFVCYDYEGREPYPLCKWSARYEEYVVIFHSWLIPDRMSLQDMEQVVKAIDARMAQYLGKTVASTPNVP